MPVACQLLVTGKLIFLHLQSSSYVHLITRVTSNEASPLPGAKLHETSRQTQPKATIAQDSETTGDLLALLPVLNRHLVTLPARLSPFTKRLITKFHGKMRKGLWAYDINISIHIYGMRLWGRIKIRPDFNLLSSCLLSSFIQICT